MLPNDRVIVAGHAYSKEDKEPLPIYQKVALGIITIPIAAIAFVFKNIGYVALSLI